MALRNDQSLNKQLDNIAYGQLQADLLLSRKNTK